MRIKIKGIPANAGALEMGTEMAPKLLREANLINLIGQKHEVVDLGDVALPSDLIRHNIAPIRNWPSPKIVWQETIRQLEACFLDSEFTIILGGGCSVFTGVFSKFYQMYGCHAKVISIDHHIDIKAPSSEICMGATAYTHWFLTSENQWFEGAKGFSKQDIIALGYSEASVEEGYDISGIEGYSKESISRMGIEATLKKALSRFREEDKFIVHFDLDVIRESDLASVYMPSPHGMSLSDVKDILKGVLSDSRVLGLVLTEFSGAYKTSEADAKKVVALIGEVLDI